MKKMMLTSMIVLLSASMANAVAVASKANEEKSPSPSSSPSSSPTASEVWLPTQPPTTTCIDTPGWIDSEGDGCDWYELADVPSCPTYGDLYEGSMGVANDNCCHCRGNGDQTVEVVVGSSPCTGNTAGWVDEDGFGCDWYEMNDQPGCPWTGDLYGGSMGVANDNCCYCFGDTPSTSQCAGSTPGWVDMFGDGCSWYETNDQPGCPNYGYNWVGSMGNAKDNCCFCSDTTVSTFKSALPSIRTPSPQYP